jgi:hypothetical protein
VPLVTRGSEPDRAARRTWIASFRDGPLRGRANDRPYQGAIFEEMVFARTDVEWSDWVLVAWDALPVDSPWEHVRYRLVEITEETGTGVSRVAYYERFGGN